MSGLEELSGRTLLIVAHPDDECVAYGTLLQRMREPFVLYATDGSPQDPYFWKKYGSREAYSRMRQQESRRALMQVGVAHAEFMADLAPKGSEFVDQELFLKLPEAFETMLAIVRKITPLAIATLAYEGGHPDHDSCNLLSVELGRELCIPVWEAPLYHREPNDPDGHVVQDFVERNGTEIFVEPTKQELERKERMCLEYPSQGNFLGTFDLAREIVRPAPKYDYSRPAHEGKLNYEVWQWSMTGAQVSHEFERFTAKRHLAKQPAT